MAVNRLGAVVSGLRRIAAKKVSRNLSEHELLERFVSQRDEGAFESLLARHGPMVANVCRRVLHDQALVEDAFQATFLVLIRKAGSIGKRELLANWLYGVAYRTASRARVEAVKRQARESAVVPKQAADPLAEITARELLAALDEELSTLPPRYRGPLVLCYLDGRTRDEAARQCSCSLATLARRLDRGLELLRARLARRGFTLPMILFPIMLSQGTASAFVPPALAAATVKAASMIAAGRAATSVVSAKVAALSEGMVRTMFLAKVKCAAVTMVALSVAALISVQIAGGQGNHITSSPNQPLAKAAKAGAAKQRDPMEDLKQEVEKLRAELGEFKIAFKHAQSHGKSLAKLLKQKDEEITGVLTKIDAEKSTLSITLQDTKIAINDLPLSGAVSILVKTKGETIDDLKVGMPVSMRVETKGGNSVISVVREREPEKKNDGPVTFTVTGTPK
jgi:RNA polymerase sigma factor (sigma-70 family)